MYAFSFLLLFMGSAAALAQTQPADARRSPEAALFEEMPVVEAASLHTQTLQQAPASVTIISEEDIRKYGYRTFGEALAAVRGFYLTFDHTYHYAGLRGFSLPGDYNTRFLVMLNGHYLTENIYSSNGLFGQDFGLDMDLIKRIEIIRGPSSALYGSNGIFASINIVTKSPVDCPTARFTSETGSFGEKKAQLSSSLDLGGGVNLLVSGSMFYNGGEDLYFPEFDQLENNYGRAAGQDAERGYHTFANLIWRDWSFTAYFTSREKIVPTAFFGTVFNDAGNKVLDSRNFVEAVYSRNLGPGELRWRLYYDQYRYRARYDYESLEGIDDTRDVSAGDWLGSRLTWRVGIPKVGDLTLGAEGGFDLRALQRNYSAAQPAADYLHVNTPDRTVGVFAQQEWKLSRRWKSYFGVRLDHSVRHGDFVSPRVAWIYEHSPRTTYKLLYGRAFRNPNAYESFYDDAGQSQIANPALRPETMQTFEAVVERKLSRKVDALATVYHYRLGDLIDTVSVGDFFQYQNVRRSRAFGAEMEATARPRPGFETTASVAFQRAYNPQTNERLTNSPLVVAKWRGAVALFHNRFWLSGGFQYLSERMTLAGERVGPVYLPDATFTSNRLHRDFDIQLGIRNLSNSRYYDPMGTGQAMDRILADGRTFFVKLILRSGE